MLYTENTIRKSKGLPDKEFKVGDTVNKEKSSCVFHGEITFKSTRDPAGVLNLVIKDNDSEKLIDVVALGVLAEEYKSTLEKGMVVICKGEYTHVTHDFEGGKSDIIEYVSVAHNKGYIENDRESFERKVKEEMISDVTPFPRKYYHSTNNPDCFHIEKSNLSFNAIVISTDIPNKLYPSSMFIKARYNVESGIERDIAVDDSFANKLKRIQPEDNIMATGTLFQVYDKANKTMLLEFIEINKQSSVTVM